MFHTHTHRRVSDQPVRRRQLLRAVSAGAVFSTVGCLGDGTDGGTEETPTTPRRSTAETAAETSATDLTTTTQEQSETPPAGDSEAATPTPSVAERGLPSDICQKEQQRPGEQNIAAIVDPAFADDWQDHEVSTQYTTGTAGELADDAVVIGLTHDDSARAYPLSVVWWHEIVNDTFGRPTLVTYCPLCRSGMVAERTVAGDPTLFNVTELLWTPSGVAVEDSVAQNRTFGVGIDDTDHEILDRGNLVLADAATGSFWSQLLARAICGPRRGDTLRVLPSRTARWSDWREEFPDTDVLLPPPHSDTSII